MENHVISMPMRVSVISPLHIGSGERVDQKWFVWNGERVTILNPDKLLEQVVARQQIPQFESFCLDDRARAGDFLQAAGLSVNEMAAYTLDCPERPSEILTFIKTVGQPYLPGSSLKGAVRSSLLRAYLLWARRKDAEEFKEAISHLEEVLERAEERRVKNPGLRLEELLFTGQNVPKGKDGKPSPSKTSNYDLLRTLGFSDSPLLDTRRLRVLPVTLLSSRSDNTFREKLTLYPELLVPGASFDVTLKFDLSLLFTKAANEALGLSRQKEWITTFTRFCQRAARNILQQDKAFYERHRRSDLAGWCEERLAELAGFGKGECLLPIGWGTGYDPKTVTDLFEPDLFKRLLATYRNTQKLGRPGGRGEWLGPELSPKTRRVVRWKEREMPLGWVKLRY